MKKLCKKLSVLLLTICLALLGGVLVACNNGTPQTVNYSVTVLMPDETPATGVKVRWGSYSPVAVDANGKASIELEAGDYEIVLTGVPDGYSYAADKATKDEPNVTIKLVKGSAVNPDGTVTYTVNLKYEDNTPVTDNKIFVQWCTEGDEGSCYGPAMLNAQGIAILALQPDNYHVQLNNIGDYTYSEDDCHVTAENPETTIVLKAKQAEATSYTVTVTQPNGTAAANVTVVLSSATADVSLPVKTDENGKAVCAVSSYGEYTLNLNNLPAGFTYNAAQKTSATVKEVAISLLPLQALALNEEMTSAEKTEFQKKVALFDADTTQDCYLFDVTLSANQTAYFSFTPPVDGLYTLYIAGVKSNSFAGAIYDKNRFDNHYLIDKITATNGTVAQGINGTLNNPVYFTFTASAAEQLTVVIMNPLVQHTLRIENTGTYHVTVDRAGEYAEFEFVPTQEGKYAISSATSEYDPKIGYYPYRYNTAPWENLSDSHRHDNVSDTDKNFYYEINILNEELYNSNSDGTLNFKQPTGAVWLFRVFLNGYAATSYPADIPVKVERLGDPFRRQRQTVNVEATNAATAAITAPTDKTLTATKMDGTTQVVFNQTDGLYHVGSADGAVLTVQLKKPTVLEKSLLSLDDDGGSPYLFCMNTPEEIADENVPLLYHDYRMFLRGYLYADAEHPVAPTGEYYEKYANADGVVAVTEEMATFLKLYAKNNAQWLKGLPNQNATDECMWLFACCYYA